MAKIITDKELADIIYKAVHDPDLVDCSDSYEHFLEDLGDLVANHFGGTRSSVSHSGDDDLGWTVAFHINDCVPSDGGIFNYYDPDITWLNGEEV